MSTTFLRQIWCLIANKHPQTTAATYYGDWNINLRATVFQRQCRSRWNVTHSHVDPQVDGIAYEEFSPTIEFVSDGLIELETPGPRIFDVQFVEP